MGWYLTAYKANWAPMSRTEEVTRPGNYSCFLWAPSRRSADRTALHRGIGERIVCESSRRMPYCTASELLMAHKRGRKHELQVLHGLCFLGMLAMASGQAAAQDVIGDYGIIHEYCHRRLGERMTNYIARVKEIERRVPGYLPKKRKAKR